ncbi:MAG: hypothetical protein ABI663_16240 [Chryseolinea sp.]
MKNLIALSVCLLASLSLLAQQSQVAVDPNATLTVKERYVLMKTKSQSFKDYKVIKESVLDGVWKIAQDSLYAKQVSIAQAKDSIKRLNASIHKANTIVKEKEESLAELTHAGTHVTLLGMDVLKSVFISIAFSIIAGLVFFAVILIGRLKMIHINLKDKTGSLDSTQREFEEYKRKAMEKQTKLSRELQDERNKLQNQRSS